MTARRGASDRARRDDGVVRSVVVVGAHTVLSDALVTSLRRSGFPSATSVDPDVLHQRVTEPRDDVAPGEVVVLVLLDDDGPVRTTSIAPLVERGCSVVVLTSGDRTRLLGECLRLGADAVVGDGTTSDRLAQTLRTLVAGAPLLTSAERRGVIAASTRRPHADVDVIGRFSTLTRREAEILGALVEGHSPKGIAMAAGISISTVRGHIQRVLSKLEVSSQREAFAMARRAGWPQADAA